MSARTGNGPHKAKAELPSIRQFAKEFADKLQQQLSDLEDIAASREQEICGKLREELGRHKAEVDQLRTKQQQEAARLKTAHDKEKTRWVVRMVCERAKLALGQGGED
jgi:hypothetical protein